MRLGHVDLSMRILITGAWGFLGGRLSQHFERLGHQVVLGSRNPESEHDWCKRSATAVMDWDNQDSLVDACLNVEAIIHTAGVGGNFCEANPVAALQVNGVNTARLIEAAASAGVRRFIYISTAHVYANPLVGVISESWTPSNPHPYATSHLAGEDFVLRCAHLYEMEGFVLRLANAFGAPTYKEVNCWGLLVNDLCLQAVQTSQLKLHTNGLQHRNFIPMASVCLILERLILRAVIQSQQKIFNVGGPTSYAVVEMARLVQARCQEVLGFSPELLIPPISSESKFQKLDYSSSAIADFLGSIPFNFSNEIDDLILFCRNNFVGQSEELK